MSVEMGIRDQVMDLATQGEVLGVAAAIVGAEYDRLLYYGERRAVWSPPTEPFSEQIGLPLIRMERRPVVVKRHPVVIALCAAEFRIGSDDDNEGFAADEDNEDQLATADWAVDLITRFARVYCAAEYTRNLPTTTILPRPERVTQSEPKEEMRVVDNRRHRFVGEQ